MAHATLIPPDDLSEVPQPLLRQMRTEIDVRDALLALGHEVQFVGLQEELAPLRNAIRSFRPHVVFNLLEEFGGDVTRDYAVVAYLDLLRVPYTGSCARGLILGRDKALSKNIVRAHGVRTPGFIVVRKGAGVPRKHSLALPLIVKTLSADASVGISEASVVRSWEKLDERVQFIHRSIGMAAIVEEYIEGRELYVTVMGHHRPQVLPPWELSFEGLRPGAPRIATQKIKFNQQLQDKREVIIHEPEGLAPKTMRALRESSRKAFLALMLGGYARIDYRVSASGEAFFLEANPNPDVQRESEAAGSAESAGMSYEQFIDRIVTLGIRSRR